MQRWGVISALVLFPLWSSCSAAGEEEFSLDADFRDVTGADLANRAFRFGADSGLFDDDDPRQGQSATLIVGEFHTSGSAGFAVTTDDGSLQGGVLTLGSCFVDTTFLRFAGEAPQIGSVSNDFFYCGVDSDGRLGLLEDEETPPIISEPPTAATPNLDSDVSLSPLALVDPAFSPEDRPETGTATLQLFGNVLSYSVTIESVSPGDELRDGHVLQGAASENGDLLFTLFGSPIQPVRAYNPPFIAGTRIVASIFLTPDEASALTDAATPTYIQLTSLQARGGLLRGQLSP